MAEAQAQAAASVAGNSVYSLEKRAIPEPESMFILLLLPLSVQI